MKKLLAILLVAVLALGLTACVGQPENGGTTTIAGGTTTTTAAPKPQVTTVQAGKLIMATNAQFKPYEFKEGDKFVGIDVEIATAIAAELGLELEIKDMAFDSIISSVNAGESDVGIAGMTVTDKRKLEVDFSISYANGVQAIIVKEGSSITCADDLYAEGVTYKVGVQLGTTGDLYCTDDFGADRVVKYANGNEAVVALLGGDVDCVIIDNEPAKSLVQANTGLKILESTYADEDYAIAVKKGNAQLLQAIDAAILKLTENGTIDQIVNKYIPAE